VGWIAEGVAACVVNIFVVVRRVCAAFVRSSVWDSGWGGGGGAGIGMGIEAEEWLGRGMIGCISGGGATSSSWRAIAGFFGVCVEGGRVGRRKDDIFLDCGGGESTVRVGEGKSKGIEELWRNGMMANGDGGPCRERRLVRDG